MVTSPSLSTPTTSEDSSSSPSSSLLPNTSTSMDSGASQPQPMTCQPLLDFNNSLHPTPCPSPTLIPSLVKRELSRLQTNKASEPDNIGPRVLRACAGQLVGVFQHLFKLSLRLWKVPKHRKTSCIVPVPNKGALTFERLVLQHLRTLLTDFLNPLQFANQPNLGVEDSIIFLTHRALSHLEKQRSTVSHVLWPSSAFNTIQSCLLGEKFLYTFGIVPLVKYSTLTLKYLNPRSVLRFHHRQYY